MKKLWWSVVVVVLAGFAMPTHTQDGRWKLGDDGSCYFDANDSGPNQCDPGTGSTVSGRWKLSGDGPSCYFDPNDSGPNQCEPPSTTQFAGRWKLGYDGTSCHWDPNDSGPNQCQP
jgi:hypothetical protein